MIDNSEENYYMQQVLRRCWTQKDNLCRILKTLKNRDAWDPIPSNSTIQACVPYLFQKNIYT